MKLDKRGRKIRKINQLKMRFYDCRVWWLESCTAETIRDVVEDFLATFGFVCLLLILITFFY